jgi:acyl-CoA thioesterase-1
VQDVTIESAQTADGTPMALLRRRRDLASVRVLLGLALIASLCVGFAERAFTTPLNIVAIGGSNTAGWGVGTENAYPALLETMLKERGYDAHVSNAGVSFATTRGMLRRLNAAVPVGTTIIILQPGGNDVRFFGTKEQRARNIETIQDRMRARHIRVILFENDVVPPGNYQWDRIHFSRKGHELAATWLLEKVLGPAAMQQE